MSKSSFVLAATLLGAVVLAQPAAAQGMFTYVTEEEMQAYFAGLPYKTKIWVGGGVQFLSLPDIKFTGVGGLGNLRRQTNSSGDWLDFGGAGAAGFETALGYWGGFRVTGGINGFWANGDDDDTSRCSAGPNSNYCVVIDPTGTLIGTGSSLTTRTDREYDYWGAKAELKFAGGQPTNVKPNVYRNDFFIAGFDVRGIDQDNRLRGKSGSTNVFRYNETLDVTYTGGFVGFGGEYSFGFIPGLRSVGGFYDRLGIRTYASLRAGLYNADTDYTGRFASGGPTASRLSLSNDELAFIGSLSFEARKRLGERTSLSLWTDYEYISSVPKMYYADGNRPTRIGDEGLFASRTMLRLNIGLGSQQLYPPQ